MFTKGVSQVQMVKPSKEYIDKGKKRVPTTKYECDKCGKTFSGKSYLIKHLCYPENKKYNVKKLKN